METANLVEVLKSATPIVSCVCAVISVGLAVSVVRSANRAKRPYITVSAPGFKPLPKSPPFRLQINMENIGVNPGTNLIGKIVMFNQDLRSEPIHQEPFSVANDIPPKSPTPYYNDSIGLPMDFPAQYVVLAIKYDDAITKETFFNIMYMKWSGVTLGQTSPDFVHVDTDEKEKIKKYIRKYLPGFEI